MRLLATVAWVGCACLLASMPYHSPLSSYAQAEPGPGPKKKASQASVRQCMKFKQKLGDDQESVDFSLTSSCEFAVVCSIEWEVSCTTDDKSEIADKGKRSTTVDPKDRWEVNASASVCEESWEIQKVRWSCAPVDS